MKLLLGLLLIVAAPFGVGMLLAPSWSVGRGVTIDAPPKTVQTMLADVQQWEKWGEGESWKLAKPPALVGRAVHYELVRDDGLVARGKVGLTPHGGSTKVVWTDEGTLDGFAASYRALLMPAFRGPHVERMLLALKASAERTGTEGREVVPPGAAPAANDGASSPVSGTPEAPAEEQPTRDETAPPPAPSEADQPPEEPSSETPLPPDSKPL